VEYGSTTITLKALILPIFSECDEMKNVVMKKYVIGFLFGLCFVFLLGATGKWH
jgi:hypothetical protein